MPDELTAKTVEEGAVEEPKREHLCLNCKKPRHTWQVFCGAACAALYEETVKSQVRQP